MLDISNSENKTEYLRKGFPLTPTDRLATETDCHGVGRADPLSKEDEACRLLQRSVRDALSFGCS